MGGIPFRFPNTLGEVSSIWVSNALAARGIDAPTGLRPLKEVWGREIPDGGRVPGPTVDEKGPERVAGVVDRDMVEEE